MAAAPRRPVLLALVFLSIGYVNSDGEKNVLMCYLAAWSSWRTPPGDFHMPLVDAHLCSHLVYAYVGMNQTDFTLHTRDAFTDYEKNGRGMIAEAMDLKLKNPKLKVLFSCGGWSEGSVKFSVMASSASNRKAFITSVIGYIKKHQFDGMDMAWEYPANRGGDVVNDKNNYATLIEELREEFDKHNYILTAQLMSKPYLIDTSYDVGRLSKALHYISFVTYQYHNPGEMFTGIHAPMNSDDGLNVMSSVEYFLKKGAPPEKVLLGFSTYGHQYKMDEEVTDDHYLAKKASTTYPGPWSQEPGFIGYNEVCYEVSTGTKWKEHWDPESKTTFAVNGRKFMSYEDKKSYKHKLSLLGKKRLAGAMVWSIDSDDFKGLCGGIKFPLITEIKTFLAKRDSGIISSSVVSHSWK